jgi:hypothetical protein
MSWSCSWVGRRAGIKAAMARYREGLTGNSQAEFDAARPHLEALVDMNASSTGDPVVVLDANGHAYKSDQNEYSNVSVSLRSVGMLAEV